MQWCHVFVLQYFEGSQSDLSANCMRTCLLWWTESLFDLGLDLCCAVLHENCAVRITLGHLLLAL